MINLLRQYYELPVAIAIFIGIFALNIEFHKVVVLLLEFIVILEVVRMINEYVRHRNLRLRFIIDVFIIFLLRDIVITVTDKSDFHDDKVLILLFIIFVFFIFRILAIKFSPYKDEKLEKKEPTTD